MLKTNFVPMKEVLKIAAKRDIAIGAFEFWAFDVARAIVEAAEETDIPVILQCGKTEIDRMGGMENTVEIAYMATKKASIPVALHLDHAASFEYCNDAVNAGFSSVMMDASALPFEQNIAETLKVARRAKAYGVTVEGELGRLVGEEGDIIVKGPEAAQTDPDEALQYVAETGIDALAVSIGTQHGQYSFAPHLNIPRLDRIREKVGMDMPIVLHGGSGTPFDQVKDSIHHGIRKVNICTDIQIAMGKAYTEVQQQVPFKYTAANLWSPAEFSAKEIVKAKIRAFAFMDD